MHESCVSKPEITSVLNVSTAEHWYQGGVQEDGREHTQEARLSVEIKILYLEMVAEYQFKMFSFTRKSSQGYR